MAVVDNQMGDTQVYPDGPGATLMTPKKTIVEGDSEEAPSTQKLEDTPLAQAHQNGLNGKVSSPAPAATDGEAGKAEAAPEAAGVKPAGAAAPSSAADAEELEALPLERFDWCTLQKLPVNYCCSCRRPVDAGPNNRVVKKQQTKLVCKLCHNTTTMLYKRVDMQSTGFREIPPHQARCIIDNSYIGICRQTIFPNKYSAINLYYKERKQ